MDLLGRIPRSCSLMTLLNMDFEERPSKIRKLEDGSGVSAEESDALIGDRASAEPDVDASHISAQLPIAVAEPRPEDPPLSKNQQKKLKRQQDWEAGREDRKLKRKEHNKARKERKREAQAAAREAAVSNGMPIPVPQMQSPSWRRAVQVPITFVFDCSYDDLMLDKEMKSLASQLTRIYSDNAKAPYRANLVISSFNGKLRDRFDTVLCQHYRNWKGVRVFDEDFAHAAEKASEWMQPGKGGVLAGSLKGSASRDPENLSADSEVIYLSSDSDVVLTELKPYSTYIIGGLVDRNRHKGICHRRAVEKGIKTAQLPIGQYLQMNTRRVLATNHVSEIMLKWLECGDWGKAFMHVIPKRKGGVLKNGAENAESIGDEDLEAMDGDQTSAGTAHDGDDGKSSGAGAEEASEDEREGGMPLVAEDAHLET